MNARGISFAAILAFCSVLVPLRDARACSCADVSSSWAFDYAGLVFVGTVIDRIEPPPRWMEYNGDSILVVSSADMIRWRLLASEGWKGEPSDTIDVYSARWEASCGFEFEIGERYLVYAHSHSGTDSWQTFPEGTVFPVWATNLCSRTQDVRRATEDLVFLGDPLWTLPVPDVPALRQNRPNPFNPETQIEVDLVQAGPASLRIYDAAGRLVRVLFDRDLSVGVHRVSWDGRDGAGAARASGVYFYELRAGSFVGRRRMVLVR